MTDTGTSTTLERPEAAAGRMARLRQRLSRSGALGQGLLALLSRDHIDEETWDEIEETLIGADLGVAVSTAMVDRLREQVRIDGTADARSLRRLLRSRVARTGRPSARSSRCRVTAGWATGRGTGCRRQWHRQDDHDGQACPSAGRRG